MPQFNIDRIRQLIGEINSSLYRLSQYSKLSKKEFLSNNDKVDSAKYNLIVARAGGRAPQDHADCFAVLGELSLFSEEFIDRLKRMAKFRNLLVHLYWKVDDEKVYQILKKDVQDIKKYIKGIEEIIAERKKERR